MAFAQTHGNSGEDPTTFGSSRMCDIYLKLWRRERDSNPRYGFPYTHFPGVRLQPLGHPSDELWELGDPVRRIGRADKV